MNEHGASPPEHYTCGHKKREIMIDTYRNDSLEADILFKRIDINGDNAINNEEASSYLETGTRSKRSSSFSITNELKKMDIDNDGIISPYEFDDSLIY